MAEPRIEPVCLCPPNSLLYHAVSNQVSKWLEMVVIESLVKYNCKHIKPEMGY